jgi:hypothetical protein
MAVCFVFINSVLKQTVLTKKKTRERYRLTVLPQAVAKGSYPWPPLEAALSISTFGF